MKKIVIVIIICLIFAGGVFFGTKIAPNKMVIAENDNDELPEIENVNQNIVKIVNGKIQNEDLVIGSKGSIRNEVDKIIYK